MGDAENQAGQDTKDWMDLQIERDVTVPSYVSIASDDVDHYGFAKRNGPESGEWHAPFGCSPSISLSEAPLNRRESLQNATSMRWAGIGARSLSLASGIIAVSQISSL
jgi:hypothetical protein